MDRASASGAEGWRFESSPARQTRAQRSEVSVQLDEKFMSLALEQAQRALSQGEVPVGAVLVRDGQVLAQGYNQRERLQDPTGHAEMQVLQQAGAQESRWNLQGTILYVTLEPCPMCMGALLLARVQEVVYGCPNLKLGAAGTIVPLHDFPGLSLRCSVRGGVLEASCARLLETFFKKRRGSGEVAESG